ncbi:MAG: hypothetical protein HYT71_01085 [Candidatus Aenigmarchaeota archaeon]|nr:hypothetical protein [Candidatus Aenigmarchaeota archaeon]
MCNDGNHSERRHFQAYLATGSSNGYRSVLSGVSNDYVSPSNGVSYRSYRR